MRIFKANTTRSIAIEASIGVAATLGLAMLSGVPFLGLSVIDPHPVWLVVAVLAARYGTRGLAVVIPLAWGTLAVANGTAGPARVLDTLAQPIEELAIRQRTRPVGFAFVGVGEDEVHVG